MKVKIGTTWHDSTFEPIMISLNEAERTVVGSLDGDVANFCCFPDGLLEEEVVKFMEIPSNLLKEPTHQAPKVWQ